MKKRIKKMLLWALGILVLLIAALITAVQNPGFWYQQKTVLGQVQIFHNETLPVGFEETTKRAYSITRHSKLYDESLTLDLCLNDGSAYPAFMNKILGPGRAWSYGTTAVFYGRMEVEKNVDWWKDLPWNLTELVAHELTHCFQIEDLGIGLMRKPFWKREGYAEYIARRDQGPLPIKEGIALLLTANPETIGEWGYLYLPDGSGTPYNYLRFKLVYQYLMEVKGMTYEEILEDERSLEELEAEMMGWYGDRGPT